MAQEDCPLPIGQYTMCLSDQLDEEQPKELGRWKLDGSWKNEAEHNYTRFVRKNRL